jgi:hypothetical protein
LRKQQSRGSRAAGDAGEGSSRGHPWFVGQGLKEQQQGVEEEELLVVVVFIAVPEVDGDALQGKGRIPVW